MKAELREKLGELLKEEKFVNDEGKEVRLIDAVVDWEDGLGKTKTVNKDLVAQREEYRTKKHEMESQLADLQKTKADLEKQVLELSGKGKKNSQEAEELERKINTLTEQFQKSEEARLKAEKANQDIQAKTRESQLRAANESLKNEIILELGKNGIKGSRAETAWALINSRGNARVVEDAGTGDLKRVIAIVKDGKEFDASVSSMCKAIADENEYLREASGNAGTGERHESKGGSQQTEISAQDMLNSFRNK